MRIPALLLLMAACTACGAQAPRSVRYDMEQIAADTVMRDTAPGFGSLGEEEPAPAPAG
jgi:hypothetical protein